MLHMKSTLFVATLALGFLIPAGVGTSTAPFASAPTIAHAEGTVPKSGTIGQGCHWELNDNDTTLTLSGGTLPNGSFDDDSSPIVNDIRAIQRPDGSDVSWSETIQPENITKLILKGPIKTGTSAAKLFYAFLGTKTIDGLDQLDTSAATDMRSMFDNDQALTHLDLSHLDTRNVTQMTNMFFADYELASLDLSSFQTQNVTDMDYMFSSDSQLTTLNFGQNFDTQNVTNMNSMFEDDPQLATLDLRQLDTQNVKTMASMFSNDLALKTIDLRGKFTTGKVTDMSSMFYNDYALTSLDLSNFDTQNVTDMGGMFTANHALTKLDLSHFKTPKLKTISGMFNDDPALTTLTLGNDFSTANVTDMGDLFNGDVALTEVDVQKWDTANVTDMHNMFKDTAALTTLDLSHFNTANVTTMNGMFAGTSKLTSLDISGFNTGQVVDFGDMFNGAASLTHLDLSNFVTTGIVPIAEMVSGGAFNKMFANMSALKQLNIAPFDSRILSTVEYLGQDATTDAFFQNDHQLSELTLGPNMQFLTSVHDGYQGDPAAVHSPELPAITPSTTYTGKWRAVAGGTTTAPGGKTAYTSDDLVKLYAGDTRPAAVTTYVWEPLVTLGQPVTIHYVDQRGKSLRATSELSGNVGSSYTIKPAKIRDYQFVKVSQGALKGTYSAKPQTITLVYRKTTTPPVTPTTPSGNSNTNTSNSSSSATSNSGSSTTSSTTPTTPAPTLKKGQAITAVKKLALYRTPNFSKHTRKFYYAKQPRTKRPQFLITGVAKSRAGHLRYLVRDVTPNTQRTGQTGYVTAQAAFTVKTYYQHAPKRVKLLTGTNAYREVALKHRVKHFKRGRVLRVKKVVTYHLTTRFMLTNGTYITGNKAQVLAQ
ncbi:BspA family leucine-rich repeat surface protein [Levilactobacillus spicheri]|uniref:DUF5776 domain-containing protein n=2 Tax=Levilactobacillus spicheri TaxID=216463 RepID=A0ABQ0WPG1_9LACO|nr:BspA family leucine-rich repeat surface protein [Levilactobacillus spicheri]GEO66961.1 hypothetical protein LSP04_13800 [Levilactobacillus spicheri]